MKSPVDLSMLSEKLGISISQISRALNHKGRVASATRDRIFQAAREADYRNLSPRHPPRIVLIPGIIHDIYRDMIDGFQREVGARSGRLVLMDAAASDVLDEFMADGVIAIDVPPPILADLHHRHRIPILAMNVYADADHAAVTLDHDTVARRIAARLPGMNRRRLLVVFPSGGKTVEIRRRRKHITELVLPVDQWLTLPARPELEDYDAVLWTSHWKKAVLQALCRDRRPDLLMIFYRNIDFIPGVDTKSDNEGWYVEWRALAAAALAAALDRAESPRYPRRVAPLLRQFEEPSVPAGRI